MKIFIKFFLIAVTFISQLGVFAQNPLGYYKMDHWDTKKGMPNDFVLNVYQTKDGFIWLTGYSGLTRFDGVSFTTFNSATEPLFKSDGITSLFVELEDSTLWVPTMSSGLFAYKNGKFDAYLKEYPNLYYNGLTASNDLIIASSNIRDSFIVFNPSTKKYFKKPNKEFLKTLFKRANLTGLNEKTKFRDWKIIRNKLIHTVDGKENILTGKEGATNDLEFTTLTTDSKGRLWLGSNKGLLTWDGKKIIPFKGMENVTLIPGNPTFGLITEDHEKGIWVATNKGLSYLPDGAHQFINYPQLGSMRLQTINSLFCDREGNIWVATDRGLFKLTKSKIVNYSEKDGIENNKVTGVFQLRENEFIVSSRDKLYLLKNGVISPYPFKDKLLQNNSKGIIFLYQDTKKNIWVCCDKVIYKINADGEKAFSIAGGTGIGNVRMAFEGIDGKVYFGIAYKGIGYFNSKNNFEYLSFPKANLQSYYISSIRQLLNGTWVVTSHNNGIIFIYPDGNVKRIENIENISGAGVFDSYLDKDNVLWFASNHGILKYQDDSIQVLGLKDGMPEVSVFQVLEDKLGYFWLPSNKGIIRAKKSEIIARMADKKSTINWLLYDEGDGMLNRQCVGARHSIVSTDGKIMVLSIGGLVEIDPANLNKNLMPPSMKITQLKVDEKIMDFTEPINVSAGNHRFIFSYSAFSFKAPEKVAIKFKLLGYDKDWISSIGDRKAFYTNLPSGKYTFQIIAANNDGVWNNVPVSLDFEILPFYYETIWFRIIAAIVAIFILWLLIRWRTSASRRKSIWLEKQVSVRTEELQKSNHEVTIQKQEVEQALEKLKLTQSQLIQSEKMASLGELTAGIAHEIQNPLNFVNNFSELSNELIDEMNEELNKGAINEAKVIADDIKQNLQKISHHGKRADFIVKGMLQHSRTSTGEKQATNINTLADEFLKLSYHGLRAKDKSFNAEFVTNFDKNLPQINVVQQDIGRVLLNLFNNAFYAVNERAKDKEQGLKTTEYNPVVEVSTFAKDGFVIITVKDNGNGIPEGIKDKIMQPFFTTKPTGEGTGLGLSLSYDIIKAHGGEIKVETLSADRHGKEGEGLPAGQAGAVFIIQLPMT